MTITTRSGKASALTHAELDANFTSLGLQHGDTEIHLGNPDSLNEISKITVTGNVADKVVTISDSTTGSAPYDTQAVEIAAGDSAWAQLVLKENEGGAAKPVTSNFTNPAIVSIISGGTTASPAALGSGRRIFSLTGQGTIDATGTLPTHAQVNIRMDTTEAQSSSTCGARIQFETSPNGRGESTSRTETLRLQDDTMTVNVGGDGKITTGGNLILDDDVVVENTLNVKGTADFDSAVNMDNNLQVDGTLTVDGTANLNGAIVLGNASSDSISVGGVMSIADNAGFKIANITKSTADYLDSNGFVSKGGIALITDGSRANVPIFYDGSDWRYFSDSTVIAS